MTEGGGGWGCAFQSPGTTLTMHLAGRARRAQVKSGRCQAMACRDRG
jgi:hypothetical protein